MAIVSGLRVMKHTFSDIADCRLSRRRQNSTTGNALTTPRDYKAQSRTRRWEKDL